MYQWTEQCQKAFENIKALLISAPVLAAPEFTKPFSLAVDTNDQGAGAVLMQDGAENVHFPVCYFSKKFNHHQRRYSTIEKEMLALVLAVQHFEVYLGALDIIIVYGDHDPLKFLGRMRNANQRLMRWSLILQPFNIEIKHVRGTDNVIADALSRVPPFSFLRLELTVCHGGVFFVFLLFFLCECLFDCGSFDVHVLSMNACVWFVYGLCVCVEIVTALLYSFAL